MTSSSNGAASSLHESSQSVSSPSPCVPSSATKLAIQGGTPIRSQAFPSWPMFDDQDIGAVTSILQSGRVNYWTGEEGRRFEKEFAAQCDSEYGIALTNGSVAIELALYALDIGPGDEVITTSRTFIASASSVVMRGALPVFADVDPNSQNITAESIRPHITSRTKAIIAVHLAGWPCDMDEILRIAEEHHLVVIEDCAQAHGAKYKGRSVGSFGHASAWSFCQDKIMTTGGEGGFLTTNDRALWSKAWSFKDHGKSYDAVYHRPHPPGFRWLHESIGTNWRMLEMQAAIGLTALQKLPQWVEARREHAGYLNEICQQFPSLRVTYPSSDVYHSYYKFYTFLEPRRIKAGWTREGLIQAMIAEGIPCFSGSCSEIYLEKAFDGIRPSERLPIAQQLGETSLMFLVHPTLTRTDRKVMGDAIEKVFSEATQ